MSIMSNSQLFISLAAIIMFPLVITLLTTFFGKSKLNDNQSLVLEATGIMIAIGIFCGDIIFGINTQFGINLSIPEIISDLIITTMIIGYILDLPPFFFLITIIGSFLIAFFYKINIFFDFITTTFQIFKIIPNTIWIIVSIIILIMVIFKLFKRLPFTDDSRYVSNFDETMFLAFCFAPIFMTITIKCLPML